MFKNPLKKYQTGGSAPTQEQQNDMREFVGWLKSNVEGFKNKSENEIAQSILDMSKSDEGKKSVQDLYSRFKKSKNQPKSRFENGGKIQDFICKHAKGGAIAGCGCGESVKKAQDGSGDVFRNIARTTPIGRFLFPTAEERAIRNTTRVPDLENVTERRIGFGTDNTGRKVLFEDAVVGGNSAETFVDIPQPGDTIVRQNVSTRHGLDNRTYPVGSDAYNSVLNRLRGEIPSEQNGGELVSMQKKIGRAHV